MKRFLLGALLALALGFFLLNVLAYSNARSMLTFASHGERTKVPESLGPFERMRVLLLGVHIPKPVNDRKPRQLPYRTERIATTDDLVLESWFAPGEEGRGVVILFHGYAGSKSSLLEDAMAFRALGFACLLVDFRGSGGSQGNTTTVGWRESDDVLSAVRVVRERLAPGAPIVLFGQSMGGAAVLRALARDSTAVRAAIVENVFDRMLNAIRNRFAIMGLPSFPAAELLCFWGGAQNGFDAFAHNPADAARVVTTPVLVLQGERDPRATLAQGRRVYDALGGPKRFVVFPGVGHEDLMHADAKRWRETVETFLTDRGLAAPPESAHAPPDSRPVRP